MSSRNQRQVILVIEALDNIRAEQETSATRTQSPSVDLIGIGPEKVAHGTFMRYFLFAVEQADFVDCVDEGGEAAVDAEYGA
jgi:hypothetical protein